MGYDYAYELLIDHNESDRSKVKREKPNTVPTHTE